MPTVDPKQKELVIRASNLLHEWLAEKKVGNISVNVFKGSITSINTNETLKPKDLTKTE